MRQFEPLRLVQAELVVGKISAAILPPRIEKQIVEPVVEVVMMRDVRLRLFGLLRRKIALSGASPRLLIAVLPRLPPCSHGFDPTTMRNKSSIVPCSMIRRPSMYNSPSARRG